MLKLQRLRALFLCAIAFIIAGCTCKNSCAYEVKIDLGITQFTPAPVGNWYQANMPYTLRLTSLSGAISVYSDPFAGGYQVGAGIGNAGRVTSDAMIHDVDDCNVNCGPVSHMQGQGTDPFIFVDARKTWGNVFAGVQFYVSRMNYENTNFDWYGGAGYKVGPIVSHIDHEVKNTPGLGVSIGYQFSEQIAATFKIIPTRAPNSQSDALAPGGSTWYRPVDSSAFGYSPFVGIEYTF